jgi:DNA-directed RNA polymerase I, II, and III subunit RPABC4
MATAAPRKRAAVAASSSSSSSSSAPPSSAATAGVAAPAAAASAAAASAAAPDDDFVGSHLTRDYVPADTAQASGFLCGECGALNEIAKSNEKVRCRQCGSRILYKRRQRRLIEILAR